MIVDDLMHTVKLAKRLSFGRPPFAICIDADVRDKLIVEVREISRINVEGDFGYLPEVRVCGAQIGSVV